MTLAAVLLLVGTGVVAGTANTIVGSGSLATFPTLLALGLAPVTANATNTVGLVLGSVSGVVGYRRELRASRTGSAAWRSPPRPAAWSARSSSWSSRAPSSGSWCRS